MRVGRGSLRDCGAIARGLGIAAALLLGGAFPLAADPLAEPLGRGDLLVLLRGDRRIWKLDRFGSLGEVWTSTAPRLASVDVDRRGRVVATEDWDPGAGVRRIDPRTGRDELLWPIHPGFGRPTAVALAPDGAILVALASPAPAPKPREPAPSGPRDPRAQPSGPGGSARATVWNGRLERFDPAIRQRDTLSGHSATAVTWGRGPALRVVTGLVLEDPGHALVVSRSHPDRHGDATVEILRVDLASGDRSLLARSAGEVQPWGIAVDRSGRILVTDPGANAVLALNEATGAFEPAWTGPASALHGPVALAIDHDGRVVVGGAQGGEHGALRLAAPPESGNPEFFPLPAEPLDLAAVRAPVAMRVVSGATAWVGQKVTFEVERAGDAPGVLRVDPLPEEILELDPASVRPEGCRAVGGGVECAAGVGPAPLVLRFAATAKAVPRDARPVCAAARLGAGAGDASEGEDFALETCVDVAQLVLDVQRLPDARLAVGEILTYQVWLWHEAGAATRELLLVNELSGEGVEFGLAGAAAAHAHCEGLVCRVDPLAAGEFALVIFEVRVDAVSGDGELCSRSRIPADPETGEIRADDLSDRACIGVASAAPPPDAPQLVLRKTCEPGRALPGDEVRCSIELRNVAGGPAPDLEIVDDAVGNLLLQGAPTTVNAGDCEMFEHAFVCRLAQPLEAGEFASIEYTARVAPGAADGDRICNIARVPFDPERPQNDPSDYACIEVPRPFEVPRTGAGEPATDPAGPGAAPRLPPPAAPVSAP